LQAFLQWQAKLWVARGHNSHTAMLQWVRATTSVILLLSVSTTELLALHVQLSLIE